MTELTWGLFIICGTVVITAMIVKDVLVYGALVKRNQKQEKQLINEKARARERELEHARELERTANAAAFAATKAMRATTMRKVAGSDELVEIAEPDISIPEFMQKKRG